MNKSNKQVDQACLSDIMCDELACRLDRGEQEGEISSSLCTQTELLVQDVSETHMNY